MVFPDLALARRIERAETALSLELAEAVRRRRDDVIALPFAGGAAVFTGVGAPINKVIGIGLHGPVDEREVEEIELAFAERGAPVQVELCALADPDVGAMLTRRGYALVGFEHVLGLALAPGAWPAPASHPALSVALVPPEGTHELIRVVTAGFAQPDGSGTPSHESFDDEMLTQTFEDFAAASHTRRYLARWNGTPAGGGTMRLGDGVAQLSGASTLPEFRRRGIQSALLHARLAEALQEGCDLAVVTTQPGSKSQHNAHRQGFQLLYARAVLVRR